MLPWGASGSRRISILAEGADHLQGIPVDRFQGCRRCPQDAQAVRDGVEDLAGLTHTEHGVVGQVLS